MTVGYGKRWGGGGVEKLKEIDMASNNDQDLKIQLMEKERKILELESKIAELMSQLDRFRSVVCFSNPLSPTHNHLNNNHLARLPRKQRAQGISAEPRELSTIQELSQKEFPTYHKHDRRRRKGGGGSVGGLRPRGSPERKEKDKENKERRKGRSHTDFALIEGSEKSSFDGFEIAKGPGELKRPLNSNGPYFFPRKLSNKQRRFASVHRLSFVAHA
ncbi:unnamed protein product [Bemisia tabaci]|uniref:Uncharacterized protein n=1 Tax=Bemisia tabaci TaxID=7038 RepID=A0A9P0A2N2_BEMTA|nr:unnamed protein product [Bemisia tabaci]